MVPARRLLDQALPQWDVRERHARMVHAPAAEFWSAVLSLPVRDLPVTRLLMRVRTFGRDPLDVSDQPVVPALPPGELQRREPVELLLGMVAALSMRTPVRADAALRPASVAELRRPLPDGWVRIAMDLRLEPRGSSTRLTTETRVLATGPRAKRAFALYWLVVRAGSGLIRHELLRAVARRAEADSGQRG